MTQLTFPPIWLFEDSLLVPAEALSGLVREVAAEVSGWDGDAADPVTVEALAAMLGGLADQIDVGCIALVSGMFAAGAGEGEGP